MKKNKQKQEGHKSFWERLKERYHLSVVNKSLLVEVYSRDISRGRLIAAVLSMGFLLVALTYSVIAFTPLKSRIIPGYESGIARMELYELQGRLLKLQQQVNGKMEYSLRLDSNLIKFGIPVDSINNMSLEKISLQSDHQPILPDKFINLGQASEAAILVYYHFFNPISGLVSKSFKLDEGHYGVDIVAEKNEAVKATLNGKVVFSSWTVETGHVIAIQHANDLLSIYKHNSVVLKKEGDIVKAGEVIAIVGNSGDFTTGPHLHFEIWLNGQPLNPLKVMKFN
jgi:murein DD-endopeptidase MepM/ murein hydrolase activator NlpD